MPDKAITASTPMPRAVGSIPPRILMATDIIKIAPAILRNVVPHLSIAFGSPYLDTTPNATNKTAMPSTIATKPSIAVVI